ncbi:MAG TPA: dicarboxylate/amino acid:cation symporter [Pseudomonadales bacterium]
MSYNAQILVAATLGIALGWVLPGIGLDTPFATSVLYIATLLSGVFIAMLKMIMIPLVFSSIAVGVSNLSAHHPMHRVWISTLIFFLSTSAIAVLQGITAMNVFKPGEGLQLEMFTQAMHGFEAKQMALPEFFQHFFINLFVNPIAAMADGNIIGVVVFALFIGIALVSGQGKYQKLQNLLEELFQLMMQIVGWIMKLAPLGIAALLVKLVATQDAALFESLGKFIAVVTGITLFHGLIVLPLLVFALTRVTPWYFWQKTQPVLLTAFATSSSAATLPLTLRCLEEDMNVDRDVANFVAPLGAQMNMDGTALYEAAAALFIASLAGADLSLGQQFVVCLTAMVAAMGAPGIPSAGMVTMVMVLQSVGLPVEAIAILLPIDRLLDAFRTSVNVAGDMSGSLVVQRFAKG